VEWKDEEGELEGGKKNGEAVSSVVNEAGRDVE
jgi:hypothetical protein